MCMLLRCHGAAGSRKLQLSAHVGCRHVWISSEALTSKALRAASYGGTDSKALPMPPTLLAHTAWQPGLVVPATQANECASTDQKYNGECAT